MEWKVLDDERQLDDITRQSAVKPQLIFKHSTRCSISSVAKGRLDRSQPTEEVDCYYLDLIRYRNISNRVSELFMVEHESPQVLLIKNGQCVYNESHMAINMDEILEKAG